MTLEVRPHLLLISGDTFGCFDLATVVGFLSLRFSCLLVAREQYHVDSFVKLLKVDCVVDIEFGLDCLCEVEIVMSLFQGFKVDVLVVLEFGGRCGGHVSKSDSGFGVRSQQPSSRR